MAHTITTARPSMEERRRRREGAKRSLRGAKRGTTGDEEAKEEGERSTSSSEHYSETDTVYIFASIAPSSILSSPPPRLHMPIAKNRSLSRIYLRFTHQKCEVKKIHRNG